MTIQVIVFISLIVISAFLSASETALLSFTNIDLKNIGEKSPRIYKALRYWLKNPNYILSAILILNNMSNILISSISTYVVQQNTNGGYNVIAITTILVSFIVIVFGEITPKLIAKNYSGVLSKISIIPITFISKVFYPLVYVLTFMSKIISWIFGFRIKEKNMMITEKDILSLISVGEEEGVIQGEKKDMIDGIFNFASKQVGDIVIPRPNVFMLEADIPLTEAIPEIVERGYSRIPIYEENVDDIIGALYSKDLVSILIKGEYSNFKVKDLMREIHYVPDTKNSLDLLKELRERKIHMAVVLDEYGGTVGIVTIEDMLEEIVGDIEDEFDKETIDIKKMDEDRFVIKASIDLEDLNEKLNLEIPLSEDYDSLGGFIIYLMGKVPQKGESIKWQNLKFTVAEVDKHTIRDVLLRKEDFENVDEV